MVYPELMALVFGSVMFTKALRMPLRWLGLQ
jgi:hypothetical protein